MQIYVPVILWPQNVVPCTHYVCTLNPVRSLRGTGKKPDSGFYLLFQAFDPVSVGSLADRQGPLHLPVAGPQAVCLGLLPPTALTHTRGLLRLRQLGLLPNTHTRTQTCLWES